MKIIGYLPAPTVIICPVEIIDMGWLGYKWGHATKILTLYIREFVLNSRYFTDAQVQAILPWLYVPIDILPCVVLPN